ncbi:glycoside hydrolase family 88 protein [Pelagicoccus sp. NFK12]|uniref:Glycoside hydrolase family 88 protein n=1 Tax=Pelagicoccus enzymogenes TaxID=2773457 RepID=A0A927IGG4_9BACT|nr:glycoside hydrolase family 88 protein [Pelagicoccus enzymogenes]MBD5779131.1 glycoside hydrolase family 88 protein [Pelagicoccus enzymogenes]
MKTNSCKAIALTSLLAPSLAVAALSSNESIATVELTNPSDYQRSDEIVSFDLFDLGLRENDPRGNQLVAMEGDLSLPSQSVDDDGDGSFDRFIVGLDFTPGQSREIEILVAPKVANANAFPKRTQAEISRAVGGKWVGQVYEGGTGFENVQSLTPPAQHKDHSLFIRYEGLGIESDKVAYRVYLDRRNGFDIFSKTKHELALHNIGQDGFESYHHLADWGMDTLKVGQSLGTGGYGHWNGKSVDIVSAVDGWDATIKENAHLQSSFNIKYKGWEIAGKKVDLDATLSMQAGSHLVHVDLEYSEVPGPIAIGLVKHAGTELIEGDRDISNFGAWTYIASWGKQSLNDDYLGMAVFFRKGSLEKITQDDSNYVAVVETGNTGYDYYFCSTWEKEPNGIGSKEAFVAYLDRQMEKLTLPVRREVVTTLDLANKQGPLTAERALGYSVQMSESEMKRLGYGLALNQYDPDREGIAKWTYTTGLLMQAIDDTAAATQRADLRSYADKVMNSYVEEDGTITGYNAKSFNIDMINSGKFLLRLWERSKDEKYKIASEHLRAQLADHPRTSEGAFWHKQIYPNQLWLDGVYMGMPFLAHYSQLFEDGSEAKTAVHEFEIARKHMRDSKTGLYYHGWDESREQSWADKKTGLSAEFWARGYGWYTMALVDVMDFLPESQKDLRKTMIKLMVEVADSLVGVQDPDTGTWYQVLDKPEHPANYTESSSSSMFVYFMAKAINEGYLSDKYKDAVIKGYQGMVNEFITFHADGSLSLKDVCKVAGLGFGRDGSFDYYMKEDIVDNGPHGVGPFILAGVEVSKLLK